MQCAILANNEECAGGQLPVIESNSFSWWGAEWPKGVGPRFFLLGQLMRCFAISLFQSFFFFAPQELPYFYFFSEGKEINVLRMSLLQVLRELQIKKVLPKRFSCRKLPPKWFLMSRKCILVSSSDKQSSSKIFFNARRMFSVLQEKNPWAKKTKKKQKNLR